jgi:hypothetical protein
MKRKLSMCVLTVCICALITGCSSNAGALSYGSDVPINTAQTAVSTVSIGNLQLMYDPGKVKVDQTDAGGLALADITGDKKYTVTVNTDANYINDFGYPADVTDAQDTLIKNNYIYGDSVFRDSPNYAVIVTSDFDTNENHSFFKIFIVPKESSADKLMYQILLCKGADFQPTEAVYGVIKDAIDRLLGNDKLYLFQYSQVMKYLQNVYDQANGSSETSASEDDSSIFSATGKYIPEEKFGTYTLDGSQFEYLEVGKDDETEVIPGTYEIKVLKGNGTYNQTGEDLIPKDSYQLGGTGNPTTATVTLHEGDRIYVSAGMTVTMKRITR